MNVFVFDGLLGTGHGQLSTIPRKQELFDKNRIREENVCTLSDEPVVHRIASSGLINSCHAVHYRALHAD